ncbi:MAG: cache domain-containing protein [Campylobacterota bacterium]|nr:cache domain-containing protein [Campylobacterota bacterium]
MSNTKISTKFLKIIIFISLTILIISSLISFYIMGNIKKDTQRILGNKIEIKLENKINNSLQLGVTNAVSIANNQNIQDALINNDKEKAYQILNNLNNKYSKFTKHKKSKIHIHTYDVKSFLRSWDKTHNGDELSSFRETINYVKETQQPVLDIEVGWANLVIRSIVPIIKDEKYIGSLEFIQDFESIQKALENEDKYFFALIDKKLLKNKPTKEHIIDKYAISQSYYKRDFFKTLKTVDLDNLIKQGYISKDNKYFSIKPIIGFDSSFIGYYVIGEDYEKIKEIINQSQNITKK